VKKVWIFIMVAVLALTLASTAGAVANVCDEGGEWSSHQAPPLADVGAVEYCVKGGEVGAGGYLSYGTYEEVLAVVEGNDHDLSHWSYRMGEPEYCELIGVPPETPIDSDECTPCEWNQELWYGSEECVEPPDYWLDAWAEGDCEGACLYFAVMDGDEVVLGPFSGFCEEFTDPYALETAGPWTNIAYNAGEPYGTLFAEDVPAYTESRECLQEEPEECAEGEIESAVFQFSSGGWAGWSCPAGQLIINGRLIPTGFPTNFSGPAKEGEPMYPACPRSWHP
jgi:hypothetical protein